MKVIPKILIVQCSIFAYIVVGCFDNPGDENNGTLLPSDFVKWIYVQKSDTGGYFLSETEVTFNQYDYFCDKTGRRKPSADFGRGIQPVINVSVADAFAFCSWLSKKTGYTVRLPDEDEWEFAAKGGNFTHGFLYSGSNTLGDIGWYNANSNFTTHPVKSKSPNELGLYDMSGNVMEWTGGLGYVRGGSWKSPEDFCRVSKSSLYSSAARENYIGFRLYRK